VVLLSDPIISATTSLPVHAATVVTANLFSLDDTGVIQSEMSVDLVFIAEDPIANCVAANDVGRDCATGVDKGSTRIL
jgi:hypothetical protein